MEFKHTPVLLHEVIENLNINPNGIYVDCTLGGAGHSSEILKKLNSGILIGFDKDVEAISASSKRLEKTAKVLTFELDELNDNLTGARPLVVIIHADFKNFKLALDRLNIKEIDGCLIDLGVSSHQIDSAVRGFSFRNDGALDMRMDQTQKLTAADIVNLYEEKELTRIFKLFGEEEFAHVIARNIVKERGKEPILTTLKLNEIVENSLPKKVVFSRGGASKKVFQALRIVVNSELDGLDALLEDVVSYLKIGGIFEVISFHSLEDRIVKQTFKALATDCICPPNIPICVCGHKASVELVSHKPITASESELKENSRSAPAKLRIVKKIRNC
ncbi:MAG: 16S rRNA (cytosine(1402)-N(4))-methyltransferase RsmH [Clostridia bacterium]|nr:16S rRNA (cytosine(1402)-N(4))-methyltransferase RsmH [Clostridia bacterium]